MDLALFRSTKELAIAALTVDPTGQNLPVEYGPWKKSGNAVGIAGGERLAGFGPSSDVTEAVRRDGFYLGRPGPSVAHFTISDRDVH
jgi:hypothetical protein